MEETKSLRHPAEFFFAMKRIDAGEGRPPIHPGDAHVVIAGVGGLGCPAATALAAAGIGRLTLIDPDRVERSNLPRQLLYSESDLGRAKVDVAAAALQSRFPRVSIQAFATAVSSDNAGHYLGAADFVVDATDGTATKLMINDCALRYQRPFCHAGAVGLRGQVLTVVPGRGGPCLRCVFPQGDEDDDSTSCSRAGIAGPLTGLIGAIQAAETLAYLAGESRDGRMVVCDAWRDRWQEIDMRAVPRCASCAEHPGNTEAVEGESQSWAM